MAYIILSLNLLIAAIAIYFDNGLADQLADILGGGLVRDSKHSIELLVLQGDLARVLIYQQYTLGQVHQDGFELLIHTPDLRELE